MYIVESVGAGGRQAMAPNVRKTEKLLTVENLTVSFAGDGEWTPVVRNLSLHLGARETLAVVGESGSGKSVTALAIMRLLQQGISRVQGSVRLGGRDLLELSETEMQHVRGNEIAMIFQEPMTSLNPLRTIGFQIEETLREHRKLSRTEARKTALDLLEKVRIPSAKQRLTEYAHNLSGGMRQRVMIAMALACKPKVLIADEPTTALDVTIQSEILALIRQLQAEEDMAVLFITHDMGVVAEVADRTLVMYHGDVVESGTTADVFGKSRAPYTRALLSAVPRLGSLAGTAYPRKFPVIDRATGNPVHDGSDDGHKAAEPGPILLEVSGLTKRFDVHQGIFRRVAKRVHAVEDISLTLRSGETLSLVGESGSGKSTTGRAIMRLIEPDTGSVRLDGTELVGLGHDALRLMRRKMQIIFQDPYASLNPRQKVGDAIASPLLAHGLASRQEARRIAGELLEQVGLRAQMMDRYPREFSGGQRQRVCIARALALNPQLLVADEAVSALDVSVKAQVINLLIDLQERLGLAYLFISHDIAVVERVSHRVAVMHLGEIVEIGPRESILGSPVHPYTKRLMRAVPVPDPAQKRQLRVAGTTTEPRSAVRPVDWRRPPRRRIEVTPGHWVQEWDESDWASDE